MGNDFFTNELITIPVLTWFIVQCIKVITELAKNKKFDCKRILGSGGMPSSHSALVTCEATLVGLKEGFGSSLFAVTLMIAFVVMYDAAGVRRAAGKQATIINKMVKEFQEKGELTDWNERLKELLGHSPAQVIVGAIFGIVVAFTFYN